MTYPAPVSPGNFDGGYAQAVFRMWEGGCGVEAVQAVPLGYGTPVTMAHEMGPGVKPVFFVGGLPADPVLETQQRMAHAHAAHMASQRQRETIVIDHTGGALVPQLLLTILT
jgi:hypothetical protein